MKFRNPYWTPKTKLQMLERWIIVHSIIYYVYDTNIVPDSMFDNNCNQLVKGVAKYPEDFKQTKYFYCFEGFDGSTGFHLYNSLNTADKLYLEQQAQYIAKKYGGWK